MLGFEKPLINDGVWGFRDCEGASKGIFVKVGLCQWSIKLCLERLTAMVNQSTNVYRTPTMCQTSALANNAE